MPVLFNDVPSNVRVPFFWVEINPGGTPFQDASRLLLIGHETSAGSAALDTPVIVGSNDEDTLFGKGSMLSAMVRAARANAPLQEIWALPVTEPTGSKATGTFVVGTVPVGGVSGQGRVDIAGETIYFGVLATDTAAQIASAISAAIDAASTLVTATAATNTVTVTCRHNGAAFNGATLRVPAIDGNVVAGFVTATSLASGSGVPSLAAGLAALGDDEFDWIAGPFNDSASLLAMRQFLDDRWTSSKQLYGHYITAFLGNLSAQTTLAAGLNDPHLSVIPINSVASPAHVWAAAVAGRVARHLSDAGNGEISRPLHSLELVGVRGPWSRDDAWTTAERQTFYFDGISGWKLSPDGRVLIDRITTTYKRNPAGGTDWTYLNINQVAQAMFASRYFRTAVATEHGRKAAAATNPYELQAISTPRDVRATIVHAYRDLERLGVVENSRAFAEAVIVERNAQDADRYDAYVPLDVVNQLHVVAANITLFRQYAA